MWQYRQTNELYHYGVPGMRWGIKKMKYEAKAESYRKAADNAKEHYKKAKLMDKADKYDARAKSLDTTKGKVAETARDVAKVGAVTAVAALGVIGAMRLSHIGGFKKGVKLGHNTAIDYLKNNGKKSLAEGLSYYAERYQKIFSEWNIRPDVQMGFIKRHT